MYLHINIIKRINTNRVHKYIYINIMTKAQTDNVRMPRACVCVRACAVTISRSAVSDLTPRRSAPPPEPIKHSSPPDATIY